MTVYIDPLTGDNSRRGESPETALRDLEPLTRGILPPGTVVRLRAGACHQGGFTLTAAGEAVRPVQIGAYGEGEKPVIDGRGTPAALRLRNCAYIELADLELRNTAHAPGDCSGLAVTAGGEGCRTEVLRHTVLRRLTVRQVNGRLSRGTAGLIITVEPAAAPCRFDGLTVEDCDISDTGSCGIILNSVYGKRPEIASWDIQPLPFTPCTGVVIRRCRVHDLPGDGMWISTTKGAVLEYNTVYNTSYGELTQYAGMWPHNSDGCVMQFNELYENRLGAGDGQGLDVDINCNDTLVQYNYSHDNEGGFLLVCTDGEAGHYNRGTVVRYNISRNDRNSLLTIKGIEVTGLQVYNNTFITDFGYPAGTISTLLWSRNDAVFANNLFVDKAPAASRFVDAKDGEGNPRDNRGLVMTFESNFFAGQAPEEEETIQVLPSNRTGEDPGLAAPEDPGPQGCRLRPDAPCAYAGKRLMDRGERDFFGKRAMDAPPSMGAHEPEKA